VARARAASRFHRGGGGCGRRRRERSTPPVIAPTAATGSRTLLNKGVSPLVE
jgi:hypothetical protein